MGLFDSIGLGSVAKVLDVGGIVKGVVDGVLPKNLASVGDLAGAVVDFKTGNVAAAVQHALESVRDLPQVARGPQPGAGNSPTNLNRMPTQFEPSPPPLASRQGKAFDWNDLLAAIKALTAALNGQGKPGTTAAPGSANGSATASTTPATTTSTAPATTSGTATPAAATTASAPAPAAATTASAPAPAAPATATAASTTPAGGSSPTPQPASHFAQDWALVQAETARHRAEHHTGTWWSVRPPAWALANQGWRGQPTAPAPSNRAPAPSNQAAPAAAAPARNAAATAPAANPPAPATTTTSAPKPPAPESAGIATTPSAPSAAQTNNGKTSAGQPTTGQTISSLAQLNGMSDAAIRDAVINGRISPDVLKDQGAMMVLQQRMNAITEMNNLMTSMMRALHDMQMAIVQNIRI